ncbi:MAG: hypothetical protein ABII13_05585 [Patescibacteria group bacterium]|nr:hypothetical protein [Patescibacteria group bacterium]
MSRSFKVGDEVRWSHCAGNLIDFGSGPFTIVEIKDPAICDCDPSFFEDHKSGCAVALAKRGIKKIVLRHPDGDTIDGCNTDKIRHVDESPFLNMPARAHA